MMGLPLMSFVSSSSSAFGSTTSSSFSSLGLRRGGGPVVAGVVGVDDVGVAFRRRCSAASPAYGAGGASTASWRLGWRTRSGRRGRLKGGFLLFLRCCPLVARNIDHLERGGRRGLSGCLGGLRAQQASPRRTQVTLRCNEAGRAGQGEGQYYPLHLFLVLRLVCGREHGVQLSELSKSYEIFVRVSRFKKCLF